MEEAEIVRSPRQREVDGGWNTVEDVDGRSSASGKRQKTEDKLKETVTKKRKRRKGDRDAPAEAVAKPEGNPTTEPQDNADAKSGEVPIAKRKGEVSAEAVAKPERNPATEPQDNANAEGGEILVANPPVELAGNPSTEQQDDQEVDRKEDPGSEEVDGSELLVEPVGNPSTGQQEDQRDVPHVHFSEVDPPTVYANPNDVADKSTPKEGEALRVGFEKSLGSIMQETGFDDEDQISMSGTVRTYYSSTSRVSGGLAADVPEESDEPDTPRGPVVPEVNQEIDIQNVPPHRSIEICVSLAKQNNERERAQVPSRYSRTTDLSAICTPASLLRKLVDGELKNFDREHFVLHTCSFAPLGTMQASRFIQGENIVELPWDYRTKNCVEKTAFKLQCLIDKDLWFGNFQKPMPQSGSKEMNDKLLTWRGWVGAEDRDKGHRGRRCDRQYAGLLGDSHRYKDNAPWVNEDFKVDPEEQSEFARRVIARLIRLLGVMTQSLIIQGRVAYISSEDIIVRTSGIDDEGEIIFGGEAFQSLMPMGIEVVLNAMAGRSSDLHPLGAPMATRVGIIRVGGLPLGKHQDAKTMIRVPGTLQELAEWKPTLIFEGFPERDNTGLTYEFRMLKGMKLQPVSRGAKREGDLDVKSSDTHLEFGALAYVLHLCSGRKNALCSKTTFAGYGCSAWSNSQFPGFTQTGRAIPKIHDVNVPTLTNYERVASESINMLLDGYARLPSLFWSLKLRQDDGTIVTEKRVHAFWVSIFREMGLEDELRRLKTANENHMATLEDLYKEENLEVQPSLSTVHELILSKEIAKSAPSSVVETNRPWEDLTDDVIGSLNIAWLRLVAIVASYVMKQEIAAESVYGTLLTVVKTSSQAVSASKRNPGISMEKSIHVLLRCLHQAGIIDAKLEVANVASWVVNAPEIRIQKLSDAHTRDMIERAMTSAVLLKISSVGRVDISLADVEKAALVAASDSLEFGELHGRGLTEESLKVTFDEVFKEVIATEHERAKLMVQENQTPRGDKEEEYWEDIERFENLATVNAVLVAQLSTCFGSSGALAERAAVDPDEFLWSEQFIAPSQIRCCCRRCGPKAGLSRDNEDWCCTHVVMVPGSTEMKGRLCSECIPFYDRDEFADVTEDTDCRHLRAPWYVPTFEANTGVYDLKVSEKFNESYYPWYVKGSWSKCKPVNVTVEEARKEMAEREKSRAEEVDRSKETASAGPDGRWIPNPAPSGETKKPQSRYKDQPKAAPKTAGSKGHGKPSVDKGKGNPPTGPSSVNTNEADLKEDGVGNRVNTNVLFGAQKRLDDDLGSLKGPGAMDWIWNVEEFLVYYSALLRSKAMREMMTRSIAAAIASSHTLRSVTATLSLFRQIAKTSPWDSMTTEYEKTASKIAHKLARGPPGNDRVLMYDLDIPLDDKRTVTFSVAVFAATSPSGRHEQCYPSWVYIDSAFPSVSSYWFQGAVNMELLSLDVPPSEKQRCFLDLLSRSAFLPNVDQGLNAFCETRLWERVVVKAMKMCTSPLFIRMAWDIGLVKKGATTFETVLAMETFAHCLPWIIPEEYTDGKVVFTCACCTIHRRRKNPSDNVVKASSVSHFLSTDHWAAVAGTMQVVDVLRSVCIFRSMVHLIRKRTEASGNDNGTGQPDIEVLLRVGSQYLGTPQEAGFHCGLYPWNPIGAYRKFMSHMFNPDCLRSYEHIYRVADLARDKLVTLSTEQAGVVLGEMLRELDSMFKRTQLLSIDQSWHAIAYMESSMTTTYGMPVGFLAGMGVASEVNNDAARAASGWKNIRQFDPAWMVYMGDWRACIVLFAARTRQSFGPYASTDNVATMLTGDLYTVISTLPGMTMPIGQHAHTFNGEVGNLRKWLETFSEVASEVSCIMLVGRQLLQHMGTQVENDPWRWFPGSLDSNGKQPKAKAAAFADPQTKHPDGPVGGNKQQKWRQKL